MEKGEIVLYKPQNESVSIDVLVENETVWLTQAQMAQLFDTTRQNVGLHIRNIIKENELEWPSTRKDSFQVQKESDRDVQRKTAYYNLDMIISVALKDLGKKLFGFSKMEMPPAEILKKI